MVRLKAQPLRHKTGGNIWRKNWRRFQRTKRKAWRKNVDKDQIRDEEKDFTNYINIVYSSVCE